MNLGPVGDRMTREQMEAFYRAYGEGKFLTGALRQAQLQTLVDLRESTKAMKEPLPSVKLWALFIMQQTGE